MSKNDALATALMADVANIVKEASQTMVDIIEAKKPKEALPTVAREGFVAIYATLHKHLGVKP